MRKFESNSTINVSLFGKEIEPLTLQIQRRHIRHVDHCLRGRQRTSWSTNMLFIHRCRVKGLEAEGTEEDLINNDVPHSTREIRIMTKNRDSWKNRVVGGWKPTLFAVEWWWWWFWTQKCQKRSIIQCKWRFICYFVLYSS